MKPVVQLERTGCGIASVAALAGVPYRQAQRTANRLGIFADDSRLWSQTQPVRRLLKHYRFHTQEGDSLRIVVGIARSGTISDQVAS